MAIPALPRKRLRLTRLRTVLPCSRSTPAAALPPMRLCRTIVSRAPLRSVIPARFPTSDPSGMTPMPLFWMETPSAPSTVTPLAALTM